MLLLFSVALLGGCEKPPQVPEPLMPPPRNWQPGVSSLDEAVRTGYVKAEFRGRGKSSGASIVAILRTEQEGGHRVYLRPGTVLLNANAKAQDMVVYGFAVHDEVPVLPGVPTIVLIEAYCLDLDKANPERQDRLSISLDFDPRASLIMREAYRQGVSKRVTQIALWLDRSPAGEEDEAEDHILESFTPETSDVQHTREEIRQSWDLLEMLVKRGEMPSHH